MTAQHDSSFLHERVIDAQCHELFKPVLGRSVLVPLGEPLRPLHRTDQDDLRRRPSPRQTGGRQQGPEPVVEPQSRRERTDSPMRGHCGQQPLLPQVPAGLKLLAERVAHRGGESLPMLHQTLLQAGDRGR